MGWLWQRLPWEVLSLDLGLSPTDLRQTGCWCRRPLRMSPVILVSFIGLFQGRASTGDVWRDGCVISEFVISNMAGLFMPKERERERMNYWKKGVRLWSLFPIVRVCTKRASRGWASIMGEVVTKRTARRPVFTHCWRGCLAPRMWDCDSSLSTQHCGSLISLFTCGVFSGGRAFSSMCWDIFILVPLLHLIFSLQLEF